MSSQADAILANLEAAMKAGAQEGGDFNETIGLQSLQADAVAEQNEVPIRSMAEMLAVLNLSTLEPFVGGESPLELASLGRQPLLTRLKTLGVAKLGERQNLANGLTSGNFRYSDFGSFQQELCVV